MKDLAKRGLSMLMALCICVSLLSGISLTVFATPTVEYVTGTATDPNGKVLRENVIYNWGLRGETATFLSPNAVDFYEEKGVGYGDLLTYAGGEGATDEELVASAVDSELYAELKAVMAMDPKKNTSYGDARYLYIFTDCEDSASVSTISEFYGGKSLGNQWDSGATWNREHIWPKSKLTTTNVSNTTIADSSDIMMIRPATSATNSSHSNRAYGIGDGYFDPTPYGVGSFTYDVRGDIARTILYALVQWGNEGNLLSKEATETTEAFTGVIANYDLLMQWLEEDPVDTWEMGRNDSVESITGTRNVFVDYPELAFALFGEEVPEDMATPSNGTGTNKVYTVSYAVDSQSTAVANMALPIQGVTLPEITAPAGYTFAGWLTEKIEDETEVAPTVLAPGSTFRATENTTLYAVYARADSGTVWQLVEATSELAVGTQVVIVAADYNVALSKEQKTSNRNKVAITKSADKKTLTINDEVAIFTLEAGTTNGTWSFFDNGYHKTGATTVLTGYLYVTAKQNYLKTGNKADNASFTISVDSSATTIAHAFTDSTSTMYYNTQGMFSTYYKSTQKPIVMYKGVTGNATYYDSLEAVAHTHTPEETWTYDEIGHWHVCTGCTMFDYSTTTEAELAYGVHTDENTDGTCDTCGYEIPAEVVPVAAIMGATGIQKFGTLAEAEAAFQANPDGFIQLLADGELTLTGNNAVIDLNGKTLTVSGEYTFTGFDSAQTGKAVLSGAALATRQYQVLSSLYVAVQAGNEVTFHTLAADVTAVSLRTATGGIYYWADWDTDTAVADEIAYYGIATTIGNTQPTQNTVAEGIAYYQENGDFNGTVQFSMVAATDKTIFADNAENDEVTGAIMNNILSADYTGETNLNDAYGKTAINAAPYVILNDGTVIVFQSAGLSIYDVITQIDATVGQLCVTDAELAATYTTYMDNFFAAWTTEALVAANQSLAAWEFQNFNR